MREKDGLPFNNFLHLSGWTRYDCNPSSMVVCPLSLWGRVCLAEFLTRGCSLTVKLPDRASLGFRAAVGLCISHHPCVLSNHDKSGYIDFGRSLARRYCQRGKRNVAQEKESSEP